MKSYAIASDGVIFEIYPSEGNEELIGFDFLDIAREGRLEAKEAFEKDKTIISNPFIPIQDGIGMGGTDDII